MERLSMSGMTAMKFQWNRKGVMQDFEFGGVNSKHEGDLQKLYIVRCHVLWRKALIQGVHGEEAPGCWRNLELLKIFSNKILNLYEIFWKIITYFTFPLEPCPSFIKIYRKFKIRQKLGVLGLIPEIFQRFSNISDENLLGYHSLAEPVNFLMGVNGIVSERAPAGGLGLQHPRATDSWNFSQDCMK